MTNIRIRRLSDPEIPDVRPCNRSASLVASRVWLVRDKRECVVALRDDFDVPIYTPILTFSRREGRDFEPCR